MTVWGFQDSLSNTHVVPKPTVGSRAGHLLCFGTPPITASHGVLGHRHPLKFGYINRRCTYTWGASSRLHRHLFVRQLLQAAPQTPICEAATVELQSSGVPTGLTAGCTLTTQTHIHLPAPVTCATHTSTHAPGTCNTRRGYFGLTPLRIDPLQPPHIERADTRSRFSDDRRQTPVCEAVIRGLRQAQLCEAVMRGHPKHSRCPARGAGAARQMRNWSALHSGSSMATQANAEEALSWMPTDQWTHDQVRPSRPGVRA